MSIHYLRWFLLSLFCLQTLVAAEIETVHPSRSVAREILQPLGMPAVSLWHSMRENLFLNYANQEAEGLEALGDWVLTPCRYILGGSDVFHRSSAYHFKPSCRYGKNDLFKTTLSLLTFPISAILGSLIKGAAYLLPETRRNYLALKNWKQSYQFISQNDTYLRLGIPSLFSEEQAPCLNLLRPSKLSKTHQAEVKAFKDVCNLLNRHNIVFWLDCGSALGAYRYQGMIPWDDDIDFSILSPDHNNIKHLLATLDPDKYQLQDWSSNKYPHTFLKLYIKKTKTLIDIYHYTIDPENRTTAYFYSYRDTPLPRQWKRFEEVLTEPVPYDVMFPLKKVDFDGATAWVPHDLERFLHYKYGENLSPTMIWDEALQSYLKVKNHPYWQLFE